jgi:hypothetical protein
MESLAETEVWGGRAGRSGVRLMRVCKITLQTARENPSVFNETVGPPVEANDGSLSENVIEAKRMMS